MSRDDKKKQDRTNAKRGDAGSKSGPTKLSRRAVLASGAAAIGVGYGLFHVAKSSRTPVFLARGQSYDGDLQTTIRDGLLSVGLDPTRLKGKRVLLKPNMVEPTREAPHMTTHPAVVLATAEVFRRWDARVVVGEAPGHVRDTEMALTESGIGPALQSEALEFFDLNYEEFAFSPNRGRASALSGFFFPRPVLEADLVVSLPKLKAHHWVGMTAATKNLYGTLPGVKYGWPKNVLHHNGIPNTVMDIYASLPRTVAIIDGILCMEGDGPILGTPKPMGIIAVGENLTALDATCARIMELDPTKIDYLRLANKHGLGPLHDARIVQMGEGWQGLASKFELVDAPHLNILRADAGAKDPSSAIA